MWFHANPVGRCKLSWGSLGSFWTFLKAAWSLLGDSLEALHALLDLSGASLSLPGLSWGCPGAPLGVSGDSQGSLLPPWDLLCLPWDSSRPPLGTPGATLERSRCFPRVSGATYMAHFPQNRLGCVVGSSAACPGSFGIPRGFVGESNDIV